MSNSLPVVMVPGLLCDQRVFEAQVAALSGLAPTQVTDISRYDTIDAMAEAILAEAPETFALCGFSMGGYVCQEILRRAPERVDRLALISTNARADSDHARAFRKALLSDASHGHFADAVDNLLQHLLPKARQEDPDLTGVFHAMARKIGPAGFEREQHAIMTRVDHRRDLAEIPCRTLVLYGHDDPLMPPGTQLELATGIPVSMLVTLPDCGHLATLEKPREVSEQLRRWYLN
ncbi:alpha/beta hydrolase [Tropicimonas sp. TH_r6]|uniref:alpha/beta fold hydrolase n=1 Tax=Tropicimonas sp. TH_r6 TaxID=3082085 RepID=UPI002953D30F|nr:alpha/beta hydrolase [Tropicimonas sp. TH_r6]MDV7143247.1 alpha/beta hydrolase [Tropicimonas sp. TH_r6]